MSIILKELKRVGITLIILNVVTILFFYSLLLLDWPIILGLVISTVYTLVNFFVLGVSSFKVVSMDNVEKAKRYMTANYFIRQILTGLIIATGFYFDFISPITIVIPLLAPKLTYYFLGVYSTLFRKDIE